MKMGWIDFLRAISNAISIIWLGMLIKGLGKRIKRLEDKEKP